MMEAIRSSETSVLTRAIKCHIPEDGILHIHRRENLKFYRSIQPTLNSRVARKVHSILLSCLRLCFPGLCPKYPAYVRSSFPLGAISARLLITLEMVALIRLGEKLLSSSLCNFLYTPVISSPSVQIFSSHPILKRPFPYVHIRTELEENCSSEYFVFRQQARNRGS
jgi:hypothetical protein